MAFRWRHLGWAFVPPALAGLAALAGADTAKPAEVDRSPADVVLSADGRWAVTANQTADTVSLVDLQAGRVLAETRSGDRPVAVAMSRDGNRVVATNSTSGTLAVFALEGGALKRAAEIPVGPEPRGVALSRDGKRAFVAVTLADEIVIVDPATRKRLRSARVGARPWFVALSPDEKTLAVGADGSRDVTLLDAGTLEEKRRVRLVGTAADNLRHLCFSPDGKYVYLPHQYTRGLSTTAANIDNGWVIGSRVSRVEVAGDGPRESIALDKRGDAVGDPYGLAVSPDGQWLAVGAGGSHELLLFRLPLPFMAYGGPGDHLDPALMRDDGRFRRIPLGGRPLGLRFTPDSRQVVVANYFGNSLQVVDVATAKVARTVALGGAAQPSAARRGEMLFTDASRSFNQWYSCGSCHVDGHTNHQLYDTKNDGRYGESMKVTPSLRNTTRTGPWTWHGHQKRLEDIIISSFTTTMNGPEPADAEVADVRAYLETLRPVPSPFRAQNAAVVARGAKLFTGKAGCVSCHSGPEFTDAGIYDVGLGDPDDVYQGHNPPTLKGVFDRTPLLHDGRARTLEEMLLRHHVPGKLAGTSSLTDAERAELVAYLRTL